MMETIQTPQGVLAISDEEFEFFRSIVYEESGIDLSDKKKALLQARLTKRLRELRIRTYHEYIGHLKSHFHDEIEHFINCITTNKTEFFREGGHFEFLRTTVLPAYEREKRRRIRIWSAGCSTGEEPYTIAIVLLDYFDGRALPDVKILATDIDSRVLETAKAGTYKAESVHMIGLDMLRRYFYRGTGENQGLFKVKHDVRRLISFRRLNLLDESYPMKNTFDIIFCRNVIIYFDKDTQNALFAKFHRYLADDGYLFMGHSEALIGRSSLFQLKTNAVYEKSGNR